MMEQLNEKKQNEEQLFVIANPISQIPKELRFDAQSLSSPQIGPPLQSNSIFLRQINWRKRFCQVQLSLTLTPNQKEQKKKELNLEYRSTIARELNKESQFKDATVLIRRNTSLEEFSEHSLLPKLTTLDLDRNNLSFISLQNNKNINFLNLTYNKLTSITLSHLAHLTVIWLAGNNISTINLASNQYLAWVDLENNLLEQLILPDRGSIAVLMLSSNRLKKFRLFYNPVIFSKYSFVDNPSGCQITATYDKKNSNEAKAFLEELKNYKGANFGGDYKSFVFKLQEI